MRSLPIIITLLILMALCLVGCDTKHSNAPQDVAGLTNAPAHLGCHCMMYDPSIGKTRSCCEVEE